MMRLNIWPLGQDFSLLLGFGAAASSGGSEKEDRGSFNFSVLYPLINTTSKVTWAIFSEVVKVVAVKIFLEHLVRYCFQRKGERFLFEVYSRGVDGPIIEEVVYRLGLLQGIHLLQKFFLGRCSLQLCHRVGRTGGGEGVTDRELVNASLNRIVRVHLSAIIFAAHHLLVSRSYSQIGMAVNFTNSYMGGAIYGSLTEEYRSLAPAILAHGISNIGVNFVNPTQASMGCYLALRIMIYLLTANRLNKL